MLVVSVVLYYFVLFLKEFVSFVGACCIGDYSVLFYRIGYVSKEKMKSFCWLY